MLPFFVFFFLQLTFLVFTSRSDFPHSFQLFPSKNAVNHQITEDLTSDFS